MIFVLLGVIVGGAVLILLLFGRSSQSNEPELVMIGVADGYLIAGMWEERLKRAGIPVRLNFAAVPATLRSDQLSMVRGLSRSAQGEVAVWVRADDEQQARELLGLWDEETLNEEGEEEGLEEAAVAEEEYGDSERSDDDEDEDDKWGEKTRYGVDWGDSGYEPPDTDLDEYGRRKR